MFPECTRCFPAVSALDCNKPIEVSCQHSVTVCWLWYGIILLGRLITFASMLRIPVAMHNVPDEKIYRPAAWNAFGTKDKEAADYRACATYGPLYKAYK